MPMPGRWRSEPMFVQPDWPPPSSSLSGGNQQKVMFARWLATRPRVMVLDQPTRGVDVGAKAQIYDLIDDLRSDGAVVVVISPEPDELIQVCDVIGVLHNGEIAGFHLVGGHRGGRARGAGDDRS